MKKAKKKAKQAVKPKFTPDNSNSRDYKLSRIIEKLEAISPSWQGAAHHSLERVITIMQHPGATELRQSSLEFGISMMVNLKPENPAEVMLIQQMIAAYEVAMEMAGRAKSTSNLHQMREFGLMSVKVMHTFDRLYLTLMKVRRPQQTVRVEHVSIHGGQTVVGQVVNSPGTGDTPQIESQAHGTIDAAALAIGPGSPVFSEDPPRDAVPVARDTARALSDARRRPRQRRAVR